MKPESQIDPVEAGGVPEEGKRSPLIWALVGIVLLTMALCCLFVVRRDPPKPFVWMTPGHFAQTLKPGRLMLLKYKLLSLPGPWRWSTSKKQHILIEVPVMTLSPEVGGQTGLSAQCITNANGMRAWILAPEDLKVFRLRIALDAGKHGRISDLPGAQLESAGRITTYDGGQARLSQGNMLASMTNMVFCGLTIDLLPKVAKNAFSLMVGLTSTAAIPSPDGGALGVRTNFDAACRVLVPNGGGLVVDAGNGSDGKGTNYWFIVLPMAVDATGKPMKLPPTH